jgi:MoaA/NifB/PqqE/SkfB family radical SAM enzyme
MDLPAAPIRSDVRSAWRLVRARAADRPPILSHLITGRCNAACATCLWRSSEDPTGAAAAPEMPADDVAWLYRQAGADGFAHLVVWGGEPLLRDDLTDALATAATAGLSVTLITNGRMLDARWSEIRGHVRTLVVSLDDVGEAHDAMRSLPGLFADLDGFVSRLRDDPLRPRLLVNTVLSRLNRGALRRVAPVAQRWGAGLYFCPMETGALLSTGHVTPKADLALSPEELGEAAALARDLQRAGYPVMSSRSYLDLLGRDPDLTHYRCRAPHAVLTVQADGSIRDCTLRDVPLATVRELRREGGSLAALRRSPAYRAMLRRSSACTVCSNPDVIETSWAWQLRPSALRRMVRLAAV